MHTQDSEEFIFGTEVDLHCFPPQATSLVVREFIKQAVDFKYDRIAIIHGKGRSQKKKEIYKILEENESVLTYKDAGSNWGRTEILIKIE